MQRQRLYLVTGCMLLLLFVGGFHLAGSPREVVEDCPCQPEDSPHREPLVCIEDRALMLGAPLMKCSIQLGHQLHDIVPQQLGHGWHAGLGVNLSLLQKMPDLDRFSEDDLGISRCGILLHL